MTLTCAACGRPVSRDAPHVAVQAKRIYQDSKPDRDDYLFHKACHAAFFEGLRSPV